MSPDSETETCRSGTRSPEWEAHNTSDLMIGMWTNVSSVECGTINCVCRSKVSV